ncbi:MAG: hypothetical protein AAF799_26785 [Myxococcota bacterium]
MTVVFSIEDLIVRGSLGGALLGIDGHELRACLGERDARAQQVWRYGSFEAHLLACGRVGRLSLAELGQPNAGEGRTLDPWILAELSGASPSAVRALLQRHEIDARPVEARDDGEVLQVEGGAELHFAKAGGGLQAIVVRATGELPAPPPDGWDKIYSVPDWWDHPRGGVTNFRGVPHRFASEFADIDADDDIYALTPLSDEVFRLALEDWQIWRRWEQAYQARRTTMETHPALPADQERHREIEQALKGTGFDRAVDDDDFARGEGPSIRVRAEYESSGLDNGHASLYVRWTPV